jgi:hypothetical protein
MSIRAALSFLHFEPPAQRRAAIPVEHHVFEREPFAFFVGDGRALKRTEELRP